MPIAPAGSSTWDNCHWYGYECDSEGVYLTDGKDVPHKTNFSDVAVNSWAFVVITLIVFTVNAVLERFA
jgi:hypothetical protein